MLTVGATVEEELFYPQARELLHAQKVRKAGIDLKALAMQMAARKAELIAHLN